MAENIIHVAGSYIDVHDNENVYLSVDKAVVKTGSHAEKREEKEGGVPECLGTKEAETIWNNLRQAGFIVPDGFGLADGVSANQATYIAERMAARLRVTKKWKVFGQLWGLKNMAQMAGAWQQTGKLPPRSKEIDQLT